MGEIDERVALGLRKPSGTATAANAPAAALPDIPEWTEKEKAQNEKEVLGFYLSTHPLAEHTRLGRFHELMRDRGAARPFEGKIESWSYAPINDTELVAGAIRKALGLESKG